MTRAEFERQERESPFQVVDGIRFSFHREDSGMFHLRCEEGPWARFLGRFLHFETAFVRAREFATTLKAHIEAHTVR